MNQVQNNPPKLKDVPKEGEEKKPEKEPGTEEQYLAVLLHQAREDKNVLRTQLLANQKQIVELQTANGILKQQVLNMEIARDNEANATLRKIQQFKIGRTIEKDDETGEVFWLPAAEQAPEKK